MDADSNEERQPALISRRNMIRAGEVALVGALAAGAVGHAEAASSADADKSGKRFSGKVAIVTGGARGQGRAHAVRLAREGADVVICDILAPIQTVNYPLATQADMDETVKLVQREGGHCIGIKADVRDSAAANAVVKRAVAEFGKVDILLANAGILGRTPLVDLSDQEFDDIVKTNLFGVFHFVRAVLPHMIEKKYGRIVATSSQTGRQGYGGFAHYAASKWGVIGLVKSAALDVAKTGITINAVCPCGVNTPMTNNPVTWKQGLPNDPAPTQEKFEAFMRAHPYLPQGVPWVEAEDVTDSVLFLASDEAKHITGSVIDVQAGAAASNLA